MFACSGKSFIGIVASVLLTAACQVDSAVAGKCRRCGWAPLATKNVRKVGSTAELEQAVRNARPGTTILIGDGVYPLNRMLDIRVPHVCLRGESGDRTKVVLRGRSMTERQVGVALSISASDVTVCDLTVGNVRFHGVQVRGELGVTNTVLHDIRVVDTGQQLLKGSTADNDKFSQGLVACSSFEYTDHAPSDYTNGIDILGGHGWIVRDNVLRRIRGPAAKRWSCGPAILFWRNSKDTVVERNLLVDCHRGIALGLTPNDRRDDRFDHDGGVIRNNVLCNLNSWADEGIEVNAARDVRIEHNTVFIAGQLSWSIGVRFPMSTAVVRNNLSNRRIVLRNGAKVEMKGNVIAARREWFVDVEKADLHLVGGQVKAVDAGVPIPQVQEDFDRKPRQAGTKPDAGAYEHLGNKR